MSEVKQCGRRGFVAGAAGLLAATACGGSMSCAASGAGEAPRASTDPVDIGTPGDFAREQVYGRWAKSHGFFVVRAAGRLYAVTSTCTHRRCTLDAEGQAMVCPCHGSRFTAAGTPDDGPAKQPLERFAISLGAAGRLSIDPSQRFASPQWESAGAYVLL